MGYFEGLTNGCFNKEETGQTVFYPLGVMGKGYILPDAITEDKIRKFMQFYYKVSIISILGVVLVFGWLYVFLLLPVNIIWFFFKIKPLISGLPYSGSKLSFKQSYINSASAHNTFVLWLFLISSIFVMMMFLHMLVSNNNTMVKFLALIILLICGACSFAIAYIIRAKKS
jgi:hypothetical protein